MSSRETGQSRQHLLPPPDLFRMADETYLASFVYVSQLEFDSSQNLESIPEHPRVGAFLLLLHALVRQLDRFEAELLGALIVDGSDLLRGSDEQVLDRDRDRRLRAC